MWRLLLLLLLLQEVLLHLLLLQLLLLLLLEWWKGGNWGLVAPVRLLQWLQDGNRSWPAGRPHRPR